MELVVQIEDSGQGVDTSKPVSESAFLEQVTNPIVYKLVRVDFDGRLVPATDDELMEVENLLDLEKTEVVPASEVLETKGQTLEKDDLYEKPLVEQPKGISQTKNAEGDEGDMKSHLEDSSPTNASGISSGLKDQSPNTMEELNVQDGSDKSGLTSAKPNFSLLKEAIDLDKLNVRELQETFRATFGRKTSIKDKMWLKRRIAMGLTNSCDIDVTSFIINGGKLLKKREEFGMPIACEGSITGEVCGVGDHILANSGTCPSLGDDMVDAIAFTKALTDSGGRSDDGLEHGASKRARKPTKRYIEELSDKETKDANGKSMSPSKSSGQDKSSLRSAVIPSWSVRSGSFVTRHDSIGGSGVRVPYVSRIRRCRPRKSVMAFTKFESSGEALTSEIIEPEMKAQPDTSSRKKLVTITSVPFEESIASEELRDKLCMTGMSDSSLDRELKDVDSCGYNSRENAAALNSDDNTTMPTAKGGIRRKHHRAWSLTEVVKLIDGVSRFGAGRWSEIKRLSFSSSNRTAVDLKDKWRNLLKASFQNPLTDKGVIRKNVPAPIPAPLLVKVRELAEINGQAPQIMKIIRDNRGQV